ncbi:dolichol-phosphate mannosyltransferase [Deltaproteobacteria bacterium]|nr:dolichol-phosphate mannosyltransferase [Deltaproteobacteria bacterium]
MTPTTTNPPHEVREWAGRTARWCVVVPVLNEGPRLHRLLARMVALGIATFADVIVVDGGSTDGSVDANHLRSQGVRGVLVKTGPGRLGTQLRIAYAFALAEGYEAVVTIDGNDKDDPEGVPRVIAALEAGYDLVQASRFLPGGHAEHTPPLRWAAIRGVHAPLLRWRSGFPWTDTTQGFRGYSRQLLADPRVAPFRDVFAGYELLPYLSYRAPRLGFRCIEVPSRRVYPPGEVPTKIHSLRGHTEVLGALLRACAGGYDPLL